MCMCGSEGRKIKEERSSEAYKPFYPSSSSYLPMYPVRGKSDFSIPLFCGYITCTKGCSLLVLSSSFPTFSSSLCWQD